MRFQLRQACVATGHRPGWHSFAPIFLPFAASLAVLALALAPLRARAASPTQGEHIVNTVLLEDGEFGSRYTSEARVRIRLPTPSNIVLMQHAPGVTGAVPLPIVPGQYRRGPQATDAFAPLPLPKPVGADPLALDAPLPLLTVTQFHMGDPAFVRVTDLDRNLDRTLRDPLLVTLRCAETGDTEVLELTETGIATGTFTGYVPTVKRPAGVAFDGLLQLVEATRFTARYVDPDDAGDAVEAFADVDPPGLVFDSRTGQAVDGARITLIDVATEMPARVFGDDGVATFPSTLTSGGQVTDSLGRVYGPKAGQFRFPFVAPGVYRLDVQPPQGYRVPSLATDADLLALPGAPFAVTTGSRGEPFTRGPGAALRVDLPVDPVATRLWISKSAGRAVASVGDFVPYDVSVTNNDRAFAAEGVRLVDVLPLGFRYAPRSARIGAGSIPDPQIAGDGRTLTFTIGTLAAGSSVTVRYVATVGTAARIGEAATNLAQAFGTGGAVSNQARATVRLKDDFLSTRSVIMGRVTTGECLAEDGVGLDGLAGVRIYLEDGTFVITDKNGLFHFEGARSGTHVVQLDLDSLPEGYEAVSCTANTRFAGRAFSQYVTLVGGAMARADFHLVRRVAEPAPVAAPAPETPANDREPEPQPEPPPEPEPVVPTVVSPTKPAQWTREGEFEISVKDNTEGLTVTYEANLRGRAAPVAAVRLTAQLAPGMTYVPGSTRIDGQPAPDPEIDPSYRRIEGFGQTLAFNVGDAPEDWRRVVTFRAIAEKAASPGDAPTRFTVAANGPHGTQFASPPVGRTVRIVKQQLKTPMKFTLRPQFPTLGATLSATDRARIEQIARSLQGLVVERLEVVGHTDSRPISKEGQKYFKNNIALSKARAKSVARYLGDLLRLAPSEIALDGRGEFQPIADNATAKGRALNRRAELMVYASRWYEETRLEAQSPFGPEGDSLLDATLPPPAVGAPVLIPSEQVVSLGAATGEPPPAEPAKVDVVTAIAPAPAPAAPAPVPVVAPPAPAPAEPTKAPAPKAAKPKGGLVSPVDGDMLPARINSVQLKARSYLRIQLEVDGVEVPPERVGFKQEERDTGLTLYSYIGVDFGEKGPHVLRVRGYDPFGNARLDETAKVTRTGEIASVRFVEAGEVVADGRTPPRLRFELRDASGDLIRATARLDVREGELKAPRRDDEALQQDDRSAGGRTVMIDKEGWVTFQPVATSGTYRTVLGHGAIVAEAEVYARPQLRDWILVGLAEGTAGHQTVSGQVESLPPELGVEEFYDAERLAFFAKGRVLGKWLLTASYDSARTRLDVGNSLFQTIDPDAYYTVYGDATQQAFDAPSARKLYLRLERDQFYALFGDFDTGLTLTELARYGRRMNGARTEFKSEHVELNAFGTLTDRAFTRDELPGDGTSGLYRLSRRNVTLNSEVVTLQVRDRFRPEIVLLSRPFARFIEYSIDYDAGTIFFKEPIPSRDDQFNPVTLVVEYETVALGTEDYTYGGRAGLKFLGQKLRLGGSVVHEGQGDRQADLYGLDARFDFSPSTRVRLEAAQTDVTGTATAVSARAYLAEVAHRSRSFDLRVYGREQQAGFGLGQQNSSEIGTRKFGAESALRFSDRLTLGGQAFRQEMLASGRERDMVEARLAFAEKGTGAYLGVLQATDRGGDLGLPRTSGQLLVGGRLLTLADKLAFTVAHAQSLWGNENADFPTRSALGAEYKLSSAVSVVGAQEFTWGPTRTTSDTRVGLRTTPWKGGSFFSGLDGQVAENGARVLANLGLRQTWQLTDAWKVDAGFERNATVAQSEAFRFNPNVRPASGSTEAFSAASAGANYHLKGFLWDSRAEVRLAETERRWGGLTGIIAELGGGWAVTGRGQLMHSERPGGALVETGALRIGAVYRPAFSRFLLMDRLDLVHDEQVGGAAVPRDSARVVNNLTAHLRPHKRFQVALKHGAKYVAEQLNPGNVSGFTDQWGLEVRYDVTESFDVGLAGTVLHAWHAGQVSYSSGPSIGYALAPNLWLGAGYNFAGYEDADFAGSNATARGPYLRFRFKFDQATLTDAASWINRE